MKSLGCLVLTVFALAVLPVFAQMETVLQNDFEKGTDGWETRGERVSIKNVK